MRAKELDAKFFGVEPVFNPLNSDRSHMIKGLNYYSYVHDIAKSREWALKWVKEQRPDLYPILIKAKDFDFENRGFVCRMIERGFCLTEKQEMQHSNFFIHLAEKIANIKNEPKSKLKIDTEEKVIVAKPINKINQCLLILDNAIEDMVEGKKYEIRATNNKEELKQLLDHCNANLQEMRDNAEFYFPATLKKLRVLYGEYRDYATKGLAALTSNKTRMKAPVKATAINPVRMTKSVKYMKSYDALKLVSLPPTSIIGGKKLYAYDVVTRRLRSYVSNADAGFMFSGTSLRNFDPVKSTAKTIRNPEAFFSRFKDGILISELNRVFKELTTTEAACTGRFNENIILLKAS